MNSVTLEKELNRHPELKVEDIKVLREWCSKQTYLPKIYDSDLALFLHANYYDLEKAKEQVESFYLMRTHLPEFFSARAPDSTAIRKISDTVSIIPLPQRTNEGYKVIYASLIDTDPDHYVYNDAVKYLNMVLDVSVYEEGATDGYIFVFDINGAIMKHSACVSWLGLKKFFYYAERGTPIRWKGLHYINTSKVANKLQDFVKNIVKNKFANSVFFHSNMDSLEHVVPTKLFPNELGGEAGPLLSLHKAEIKKLESHHDWLVKSETRFKINDNLYNGEMKSALDIFGPEKEFKNFETD